MNIFAWTAPPTDVPSNEYVPYLSLNTSTYSLHPSHENDFVLSVRPAHAARGESYDIMLTRETVLALARATISALQPKPRSWKERVANWLVSLGHE